MLYRPEVWNKEREALGKKPLDLGQQNHIIRMWSSAAENRNRMRNVDEWHDLIVNKTE